ncbi:MAG TPA: DNA translocase FtsK 4TM domain-containing protein, partial [Planctomycetota bacterium]|nr:DNA translocase FtsK 4TM domain-containing protein [Planctomycetota bacterium]
MATSEKNKRSLRTIIGVFLILLAIFLEFSLVTHSTTDNPAWNYNVNNPDGFSNWGGTVGNFFATNLFLVFGIVSYLLAAMLGLWGVFLIWRKQISVMPLKIACFIIFIVAALAFGGLITPYSFNSGRMETLGGLAGAGLAKFATHTFGMIGSYLLTIFILGASLILATDWLAYDIGAKVGRIIYALASGFIGFINSLRQGIDRKHQQDQMIKQVTRPSIPAAVAPSKSLVNDVNFDNENGLADEAEEDNDVRIAAIAAAKPIIRAAQVKQPAREVIRGDFKLPGLDLLDDPEPAPDSDNADEVKDRIVVIEGTLSNFGIEAKVVNIERGPVVTKYEIELAPGISVHKVAGMIDDLSIALKSPNVTVVAPIPGKS